MKGIYLTEEGKKEIEAKITELEKVDMFYQKNASKINPNYTSNSKELEVYKEILQSATILPVEESWEDVEFSLENWLNDLNENYPQGVIIQPKH
jgi:hypothetical protein